MKEIIRNQISSEIFKQIGVLKKEENQGKQEVIAREIIKEIDIEDFTPYISYDDEGDIFIAMNYYYSPYDIEEALLSGKHDVILNSNEVYIDDESLLKEFKEDTISTIRDNVENKKQEKIKLHKNQKKSDEISEKIEFFNNQLMNLVNFDRPKYVGNYTKIIEIDEEILCLEKRIKELELELKEIENDTRFDR